MNEFEDNNGRAVAILGHNVAMGLFNKSSGLVGKTNNVLRQTS
jgi:hypothetical protein